MLEKWTTTAKPEQTQKRHKIHNPRTGIGDEEKQGAKYNHAVGTAKALRVPRPSSAAKENRGTAEAQKFVKSKQLTKNYHLVEKRKASKTVLTRIVTQITCTARSHLQMSKYRWKKTGNKTKQSLHENISLDHWIRIPHGSLYNFQTLPPRF